MVTNPKSEHRAVWDIASAIAVNRGEEINRPFIPEAEHLLRLFIGAEDRYPTDCLEVESRFPGCLAHGVNLRAV
jgi:hypothetical protein